MPGKAVRRPANAPRPVLVESHAWFIFYMSNDDNGLAR